MRSEFVVAVAALIVALGCQQSRTAEPPSDLSAGATASTERGVGPTSASPGTAPIVSFEPMDMLTSVGETVPTVLVATFELPDKGAPQLDELRRSVVLQTWPERSTVEVEVTVQNPAAKAPNGRVMIRPLRPLADRWYVLRAKLPSGAMWPRFAAFPITPDGFGETRFRPGSDPRIWGIEVCDKGQSNVGMQISFSENIVLDPDRAGHVTIQAGDAACKVNAMPEQPTNAKDVLPRGTKSVDISCCKLDLARPSKLSVTVHGARSGQMKNVPPLVAEFLSSDLTPMGTGCSLYRPRN